MTIPLSAEDEAAAQLIVGRIIGRTKNTNDIVHVLRDFCEMGLEGGDADPLIEVMHSVAADAVAEIERLRAALKPLALVGR